MMLRMDRPIKQAMSVNFLWRFTVACGLVKQATSISFNFLVV